ncbi:MAG: c-type cytochrome, partial [Planctomycetales bacterium]
IASFALMTVYLPHGPRGEWVMRRIPSVTGFHADHHENPQYPWYQHFSRRRSVLLLCCGCVLSAASARAADPNRGLELILSKSYSRSAFDQETFDAVWRTWPEPLRAKAKIADQEERRKMAFSRYGLTRRPGDESGKPLQFVVDEQGKWSANCFSCHGGQVAGKIVPGLPNSRYAIQTLLEETAAAAQLLKKPLPKPRYSGTPIPIQTSNGVSNAVTLTYLHLSQRDADLNRLPNPIRPELIHFDSDPPPWWRIKKRKRLYADGFAKKSHRALMVFLLGRPGGAERFHAAEQDFRDILAWIETIEPPKYPFPIDRALAARGRLLFENHCADCHGTHGEDGSYPEMIVPLKVVGTDPVRLTGVRRDQREAYERSWFAYRGKHKVVEQPVGYLAPPLDGIWASAPYFHNGSVPTLRDVLNPRLRPIVWKRSEDGYDRE